MKKTKSKDIDKDQVDVIVPEIVEGEVVGPASKDHDYDFEKGNFEDEIVIEEPIAQEDVSEDEASPESYLPVIAKSKELEHLDYSQKDALKTYLQEIGRYELLTPEKEKALTKILFETGDIEVAKELVRANLRLVVKIAMDYRHAYQNILDLIQEGNIGLMKAVSKFDPSQGTKLSYYASWWIKSYILKFILDNFRLVKIGTTAEQKKLFYNLIKEKERLERLGVKPENKLIAENLGVSEKAVELMDQRLSPGAGEFSIDKKLFEDSNVSISDTLADSDLGPEDQVANEQELELLNEHLKGFVADLGERDREIFTERLLSEVPPSLQKLADQYGVSRERIRQIEERLLKKLKVYMTDFLR